MSRAVLLFGLGLTIILSCTGTAPSQPTEEGFPTDRPFLMGFSPWPYAATPEAVDWTYQTIQDNGDIISHHMEEGVPWDEALADDPYPQAMVDEVNGRLARYTGNEKILLQINPLNMERNGLAAIRGASANMSLSAPWTGYDFDHPDVEAAFLHYARYMIDAFEPDYVLLGVEVNILAEKDAAAWPKYVSLHTALYTTLKTEYPDLPLGVSVIAPAFFPQWAGEYDLSEQTGALEDLEPYLDFLSFSVHPFMSALLANSFPEDYFDQLFAFTDLPVSISESSYPAQEWTDGTNTFSGTPEKSRRFLRIMLESLHKAEGQFLIWFSAADFDTLWQDTLAEDPVAKIWRDTGLWDESLDRRLPAFTWQEWFAVPYAP
jgi:hypothetical protein